MQNEMLSNKEEKNYNSWELNGDDVLNDDTGNQRHAQNDKKSSQEKQLNKNSAAKAATKTGSAVGNTNPNKRTGLSDDLNNTGTNVTYTERGK